MNPKPVYVTLPLESVRLDPRNERLHPPAQIEILKISLLRFGQRRRVLIDRGNKVIAHHGVVMALRALGRTQVKCKYSDLKGAKRDAYRVADNQLAALSKLNLDRTRETILRLQKADEERFSSAALGLTDDELKRIRDGGAGWNGKDLDIDSIPDYDASAETLIVKIEEVKKGDAARLVARLNSALEQANYSYRAVTS